MDAIEFAKLWVSGGDEVVKFPSDLVDELHVPSESNAFLKAGLPKDAAPFLSFGPEWKGVFLPTAVEQWDLPATFSSFRIIGSTGQGDPVCLDESAEGVVISLNHDARFRQEFVNSSLSQFMECILAYRDFVERVRSQGGEDAFIKNNVPRLFLDWITDEIRRIDADAMKIETNFWRAELRSFG
jgi:hypothetical protein